MENGEICTPISSLTADAHCKDLDSSISMSKLFLNLLMYVVQVIRSFSEE